MSVLRFFLYLSAKLMIVDLRQTQAIYHLLCISGLVEKAICIYKLLCVHFTDNLSWALNIYHFVKKAQQIVLFLKSLRKTINLTTSKLQQLVYHCGKSVVSLVSSCVQINKDFKRRPAASGTIHGIFFLLQSQKSKQHPGRSNQSTGCQSTHACLDKNDLPELNFPQNHPISFLSSLVHLTVMRSITISSTSFNFFFQRCFR